MEIFVIALVSVSLPSLAATVAVPVGQDAVALGADLAHDVRSVLGLPEGSDVSYLAASLKPQVLALKLLLIASGTLLALVAAFAVPRALVRASAALSERPGRMLLTGILFHASVALTAVLFTALIRVFVGLPLLGLLLVVVTLVGSIALGAAFHCLGERMVSWRHAAGTSGYAKILLGALVVGALSFLPIVGEIAWCVASCAGAGAVLATWRTSRAPLQGF